MSLLGLAVLFLIIALVAYFLGYGGVAGMSKEIGKLLLVVFLILAIIAAVFGGFHWHSGVYIN